MRTHLPDGLGAPAAAKILAALNLTDLSVQQVHIDWQAGTVTAVVYVLDKHGRSAAHADGTPITTTIGYPT